MAKRKASRGWEGKSIRVREGVTMPEFSQVIIGGWTGTVVEAGAGDSPQLIVEWDAASLSRMPADYQQHCETQGLYAGMASLSAADVDTLD